MDEKNALEELRMMSDRLHNEEYVQDIVASDLTFVADRIEREWVELPRDRDGVPIHVGDTVWTTFNHQANVIRICILRESALVLCKYPNEETAFLKPYDLTHEYPDSLGRIADELEAWCDGSDVDGDACEKPRDLAKRIRKLAKKEG